MLPATKVMNTHSLRSKSVTTLPSGALVELQQNNVICRRSSESEYAGGDCASQVANGLTPKDLEIGIEFLKVADDEKAGEELTPNASQHYVDEWVRSFKCPDFMDNLKRMGVEGRLRSSRFRSVCWRVYLECLSDDQSLWVADTTKARKNYDGLKKKFLTNPRMDDYTANLKLNNPLSQDETSPWNRYFQDGELKITIRQDVIRTFPEIEFFHSSSVRDMMVNILFCYAREFPQMSYKQGMHELLAPIIFVLHSDHQAFLHASEIELLSSFDPVCRDEVKILLNPNYIEHDAFHMFCQVMEVVEQWYIIRDIYPCKVDTMNIRPFARPQDLNPTNVIIFKLTRIQDQLLKRHDRDLYLYLEKLEIAPQIYGIRWLRLLFGREYPLQDLLVIWDVIFADSITFDLVEYIFIAMLKFIRTLLLSSDYATCLSYLMRYPAVTDVQYIVDEALHMRDPQKYPKPNCYSMQIQVPTVGGRTDIHRTPMSQSYTEPSKDQKQSSRVTSGFSSLRRMASRPKTLALEQDLTGLRAKASSEPTTFESRSPSPTLSEYVQVHSQNLQSDGCERELQPLSGKGTVRHPGDERSGDASYSNNTASKAIGRKGSWSFKKSKDTKSKDVPHDVSYLQGKLNDAQSMCSYCAQKMTIHIDRLQECVLHKKLENDDEMLIALAGLKQVRDILKGTLKYSQNLLDGDDIVISDNHYPEEPKNTSEMAAQEIEFDDVFKNKNSSKTSNEEFDDLIVDLSEPGLLGD